MRAMRGIADEVRGLRFCVFAGVPVVLFACMAAQASPVTAVFEGPITTNTLPSGNPFLFDDPVIMRLAIVYESTTPDVYSLPDPRRSTYRGVSAVNFSVLSPSGVPLYYASGDGANARFLITDEDPLDELGVITYFDTLSFLDSSPAAPDPVVGTGTLVGPDLMGMPLWMVSISAVDEHDGGGPLGSDALPMSFVPADWGFFSVSFIWHPVTGPNVYVMSRELTATTAAIPVPGAFLLAGMGVGMIGWVRRRRLL